MRFKRKVSKVHSENLLKNSRRATEVNIQAANRFITAAIPELSSQQKQALRQVPNVVTFTCMLVVLIILGLLHRSCEQFCVSTLIIQVGAKRKAESEVAGGPQKKHDKDEALAFLEETMQGLSGGQA